MVFHYVFSHLLTVLTALGSIAMVLRLLATKRSPQSLLAWVLALVFVPLLAIPLYFAFGARKFVPRGQRRAHPQLPNAGPIARVLSQERVPPAREAQHFELLGDGVRAYEALLAAIAEATRSIDVTLFILGDDPVGWSFVDALVLRAQAGVRVRVILDALGSARIFRRATRKLEAAGATVHRFMPLWHAPLRGKNNLRCHRKIVVLDDARVFLGGMNVAEEYLGPTPRADRWRDLAALVTGDLAHDATALFESDWTYCRGAAGSAPGEPATTTPDAGHALLQLVPSGPDMEQDTFYDAILTALFVAEHRIELVTPYYVPDDTVQHALVLAARRGVRVTVTVPSRSNHPVADYARRGLLRELELAGVTLAYFPHGMVHAKAMTVDDTFAYVGSPNLDMRSFFLDYEDALCIYSPADVETVRAWLSALTAESVPTPPHSPREHWILERVARLVAPEL